MAASPRPGFEELKIEEVLADRPGAIKIGPFGSQLRQEEMVADGRKVYGQENVIAGDWSLGERRISASKFSALSSCRLEAGDLVLTMMGTIGKCGVFPEGGEVGVMDSHLLRIQPDLKRVDRNYLRIVLQSDQILGRQVTRMSHGTIMAGLSSGIVRRLSIPIAPIPEQRRIAEIIDTLDEAIHRTEQLIAKLQQLKQGLLQGLLTRGVDDNGEVRDPVRHPEQFTDSPIGVLPRKWEVLHLGDLYAESARNGLYKPSQFHGRGPLMVQMGNIFRGLEVSFEGAGRVEVTPSELVTYGLRPGDLLFARRSLVMAGAGKCALVTGTTEPSTFESSIVRVRVKPDRVAPLFVAYFLMGHAGYRDRRRFIRQVAVSGVSGGDIAEFLVAVPPRREQDTICASVRTHDQHLATESAGADKLRLLKQGLMEDLLTGRVRVTISSPRTAA